MPDRAVRLWRISDFADLSGQGGFAAPARWHTQGRGIVYLADHPASALLEMIVNQNLGRGDLPTQYQLLAVDVSDEIAFQAIAEADLPQDWRRNRDVTQALGDDWLARGETLLARVPSALVPRAFNWLFNPLHPDAQLAAISEILRTDVDTRLIR